MRLTRQSHGSVKKRDQKIANSEETKVEKGATELIFVTRTKEKERDGVRVEKSRIRHTYAFHHSKMAV